MKSLRRLALAIAVMAAAYLLLAGAGTASADALCKMKESLCAFPNLYPEGTAIKTALKSGGNFHFQGEIHSVDCSTSTLTGEVSGFRTEPGTPFPVKITGETFENCISKTAGKCQKFKATNILSPAEHLANMESVGDGSLSTFSGAQEIEMECTGLACTWEYLALEEFPLVHTFTGGSPPIETMKVTYVRKAGSGLCGKKFIAEGQREFTSPSTAFWTL